MTRSRWTISIHRTGRHRDVDVFLYDQLSHMRGAATKHSKDWEGNSGGFSNALAVTHGFQLIRINGDGTETEMPQAVIIRFARTHINPEIVAHEVAHAAQHLYGMDCIPDGDAAKDHFDAGNETFAHLAGDLFSAVWHLFHESIEEKS